MARFFAEIVESLTDCVAVADDGSDVYIPARSLFAMPVIEKDGQRFHGRSVDLKTLAVLKKGQAIPHGPVLRVAEVRERSFVCCNCCSETAKTLEFTGAEVVNFVREAIARDSLQQRHNRLHKENSDNAGKICRQEEEIQKLREEVDRLNYQLENVSKEREKLAGQVEKSKVASDAELVSLKTLVASANDRLKKNEQHQKDLQDIADHRAKEIERQKAEILMLREQVEGLKNLKVEVTGSEFVTIRGATSGETELASLRAKNDRLQAELASLRITGRSLFSQRQKIAALEKRAKESEAVAQGLADDVQRLNKKITELVSARSGDDVKIVSIEPLESPLGDVVKPRGLSCPKASDFYVTTRQPVFKPGALVGDSSVTEVCNLVSQEKIELNTVGLEVVYSGKFCYSEIPPSKQVASVLAFSPAFVAELMAKASRYDKVEAIVAPIVEVPTQDLKGLSNGEENEQRSTSGRDCKASSEACGS